jgi:general secretion pathway protein G
MEEGSRIMNLTGLKSSRRGDRGAGFTLIELLMVLLILGILAMVVISNFGNLTSTTTDTALASDLQNMRSAITVYYSQHGNVYPTGDAVVAQLTLFSDINGNTSATPDPAFTLGPYLPSIPGLPEGIQKGFTGVTTTPDQAGCGWYYDADTGQITANADPSEVDDQGRALVNY